MPFDPSQFFHPSRRAFVAGLGSALTGFCTAGAGAMAAVPTVTLTAAPSRATIKDGQSTPVLGFNGACPGPTIRIKKGETLAVRLENRLDQPLALHWVGVRGSNSADGVGTLTQSAVAPGASSTIEITPPDSGTFLYRPMVPGKTTDLVSHGLSGLLIVEEDKPPAFDKEVIIALNDWLVDDKGHVLPTPANTAGALGRLGNVFTINGGTTEEVYTVPRGAIVRLRLAGLMVARLFNVRFQGARAYVAAVDSQPTDTFEPLKSTLPLKPGSRYDVFLELPDEVGATASVTALIGAGIPIARFTTDGSLATKGRSPIAPLPQNTNLPAQIPLQSALRPNFVIDGGLRPGTDGNQPTLLPWLINGEPGSLSRSKSIFSVGRDRVVVLSVSNKTSISQTIHLHGHAFRVLNQLDDGWDPYWLDTVTVPEGRTTRLAFVADNPGRWLIGSALLDRLDRGLFGWFEVK